MKRSEFMDLFTLGLIYNICFFSLNWTTESVGDLKAPFVESAQTTNNKVASNSMYIAGGFMRLCNEW